MDQNRNAWSLFRRPRGVLILHCNSEDVRDRLYDHSVIILGNENEFRQKPLCDDLLYVDVIGFHAEFSSFELLLAFMAVGLKPISTGQSLYEPRSKIYDEFLRVYLDRNNYQLRYRSLVLQQIKFALVIRIFL